MPAGVRAVVVACDDCGDASNRYVGWVQIPVAELRKFDIPYESHADSHHVMVAIRRPDGGPWALLGTPEADAITLAARQCATREIPLRCRPGR